MNNKNNQIKNFNPLLQQGNINDRAVFDHALLDKLKGDVPIYSIGIDANDENLFAYCFCKQLNGKAEILLAKEMTSKKEFKEEVINLSKYFNATIYGEID